MCIYPIVYIYIYILYYNTLLYIHILIYINPDFWPAPERDQRHPRPVGYLKWDLMDTLKLKGYFKGI